MLNLFLSSPPSPELERPPKVFIAIARASCASGDKAPKDIPAVSNLWNIFLIDSTFVIEIFLEVDFKDNKSLIKLGFLPLTRSAYFL